MRRNKPTGSENQQTQAASPAQDQRRVCNALSAGPSNFFRQLRIASFRIIEVNQLKPNTVFNLALPQIMQTRPPTLVMLEIFSYMLRKQNVPGVSAIHDALGGVNSGAGYIHAIVHIHDFIQESAVDSHSDRDWRRLLFDCLVSSNAHRTGDSGLSR